MTNTNTRTIVAIDLGKYKSVACIYSGGAHDTVCRWLCPFLHWTGEVPSRP